MNFRVKCRGNNNSKKVRYGLNDGSLAKNIKVNVNMAHLEAS